MIPLPPLTDLEARLLRHGLTAGAVAGGVAGWLATFAGAGLIGAFGVSLVALLFGARLWVAGERWWTEE